VPATAVLAECILAMVCILSDLIGVIGGAQGKLAASGMVEIALSTISGDS